MKTSGEELKKSFEELKPEAKHSMGKLQELIEKNAMSEEDVRELIENHIDADKAHPELAKIEEMTSQEYAELYAKMAREIMETPEKYEFHMKHTGMSAEELSALFAQINGTIVSYPEIWESQENARMLHPRNLSILANIFKKKD